MKRKLKLVLFTAMGILLLSACGSEQVVAPNPCGNNRPAWTCEEPATSEGVMSFVGLSAPDVRENAARKGAMEFAREGVVNYLGTEATQKFEQIRVSYGLSSKILDPTESSREFRRQMAGNVVRLLKAKKWYTEQESNATGRGYKVFVLAEIPVTSINEAFKTAAEQNLAEAERQAREASDQMAKDQWGKVADAFRDAAAQGLIPPDGKP